MRNLARFVLLVLLISQADALFKKKKKPATTAANQEPIGEAEWRENVTNWRRAAAAEPTNWAHALNLGGSIQALIGIVSAQSQSQSQSHGGAQSRGARELPELYAGAADAFEAAARLAPAGAGIASRVASACTARGTWELKNVAGGGAEAAACDAAGLWRKAIAISTAAAAAGASYHPPADGSAIIPVVALDELHMQLGRVLQARGSRPTEAARRRAVKPDI